MTMFAVVLHVKNLCQCGFFEIPPIGRTNYASYVIFRAKPSTTRLNVTTNLKMCTE